MIENGEFTIKKALSSCLSAFNLKALPKNSQEPFVNHLREQFVDLGFANCGDVLGEDSFWSQNSHNQFTVMCHSDVGSVRAFPVQKLLGMFADVGQKLEDRYISRFEERNKRVALHIKKLNNQLAESAHIVSGMTSYADLRLNNNFRPKEEAEKVSKIHSLRQHIRKLYRTKMEEERKKKGYDELKQFQIFDIKQREPKMVSMFGGESQGLFKNSVNWKEMARIMGQSKEQRRFGKENDY